MSKTDADCPTAPTQHPPTPTLTASEPIETTSSIISANSRSPAQCVRAKGFCRLPYHANKSGGPIHLNSNDQKMRCGTISESRGGPSCWRRPSRRCTQITSGKAQGISQQSLKWSWKKPECTCGLTNQRLTACRRWAARSPSALSHRRKPADYHLKIRSTNWVERGETQYQFSAAS